MKLRPLIWAGILATVAFSLGRALVVLLAGAALRAGRRAVAG